jgi:hypothetical protein
VERGLSLPAWHCRINLPNSPAPASCGILAACTHHPRPTFHPLNLSAIIATEVTLMHRAYNVAGTLTDAQTVLLERALPLTPTKVRLVIEPLLATSPRQYQEVIAKIRERQRTRGHKPPTREEVDAYLPAERDSWEE